METGDAFRNPLHREQHIVDRCDERIGAIEDAIYRLGCYSGASAYSDCQDRPERALHLVLARQGAVPYRQGDANRNGESHSRSVVRHGANNEKDQIQASDDPEEMSDGVTTEKDHPEQGVEACGDESENHQTPPAPSGGEILASHENGK